LSNGPHTVTVWGKDHLGAVASWHGTISVAIPTLHYSAQIIPAADTLSDVRGLGMNNLGAIAGYVTLRDGSTRAMLWSNGVATQLSDVASSRATDVNDAGMIAGGTSVGGIGSVVVWNGGGALTVLDMTSGAYPLRINARGDVLGTTRVYSSSGVRDLGFRATDMNDAGVIIGGTFPDEHSHFFDLVIDSSGSKTFPKPYGAGVLSAFRHINSAGVITGQANTPGIFVLRNGVLTAGDRFIGTGLDQALNNRNDVLTYLPDGSVVVWTIDGKVRYLALDAPGWRVDEWTRMNDRGQILAHAFYVPTGQRAILRLDPQ
jgi:hypothetical protein